MTAPHGPSEAVVDAIVGAWRIVHRIPEGRWQPTALAGFRSAMMDVLRLSWPTLYAEVRAAVVVECMDAVARSLYYVGDLNQDERSGHALGVRAAADRLRALLPPVSAPGPTLPEVDIGLHTRVEILYCVDHYEAQLVDELEQVLGTGVGGTPSAALLALASRAERGPGDANG